MNLSSDAQKAWDEAMMVRSKNPHKRHPNRFRRDVSGNIVCRTSYLMDTPRGWYVNKRGKVCSMQRS